MRKELLFPLIKDCIEIISKEPPYLYFPICNKKLVIIGDTHGDIRTSLMIIEKFTSDPSFQFIFLGDEIDRETSSLKPDDNIIYLLEMKREYPDRIFFLLGNHSLNPYSKKYPNFKPCSFWSAQPKLYRDQYQSLFAHYHLLATTENGVIMTHSTLPTHGGIQGDTTESEVQECLWSDYCEGSPEQFNVPTMRPKKYSHQFYQSMNNFGKNILIRGHDPAADLIMFDNKCLTLQTNRAFSRDGFCDRRIAILDLSKKAIQSVSDIQILNIDNEFKPEKI